MGLFGSKKKVVRDTRLSVKKTVNLTPIQSGQPAANVSLIKQNGVSFEKKVASAVNMQKSLGIANKFDVIAIIDESYSMQGMFRNGTVQAVVERALAWTAGVDSDGMAPVGGFADGFKWHKEVDLSNVMGIVDNERWGVWGGTDLTAGLQAAFDVAKQADNPVYLFVVTDGAPNDQRTATRVVQMMSEYPIFIKFLLVGNDNYGRQYLESLDNMTEGRLFDNVDTQHIKDPSRISDDDFNKAMSEEVSSAIAEMRNIGLVR